MVGPSKILTVSYGTFSCTLEGFDNPFSTMRGIAEYFRDIAADDRYFGAEPPIPDAEMLHRIAQGDAEKRVVAHVESNSVTLRQVDDADTDIATEPGLIVTPEAQISDPFVDEPADIVALNEPSEVQADSVAAKLARIRAVVSYDNVATDTDNASEHEAFTTSPISAAFDDAQTNFDIGVEVPDTAFAGLEPVVEDAAHTAEPADTGDWAEADSPEQEPTADDTITSRMADHVATEAIAQFMGEPEVVDAEPEADDSEASDSPDSSSISRVVKMRRADFDNATGASNQNDTPTGEDFLSADDVQVPDDTQVPDEAANTQDQDDGDSSLSAEDEAELMANLAEVQRKADAEERSEKEGRALLENSNIESSGESVSRILDVTNSELKETEGTRRRSAIAHLKAAVAATRADRGLTSKRQLEDEEEINQYRDDLAKVVMPRRPADGGKSARQAPLMLVSEQRVDAPTATVDPDAPTVLPRRIVSKEPLLSDEDKDNIFLDNNSFAEFAAEMGATELPDLLEAAAAYSAYVQGQAYFSRPQIMQAVAGIRKEDFSREEGLRSFGQLLRRGKIKKLGRGQFTVAETTRFRPQPRAVGE